MPGECDQRLPELFTSYVTGGARRIRVVGEVPHPGTGHPWEWWARYEAAVNHALAEFPLWGLCPYDTRITPAEVLADVERTHPHLASADGRHLANAAFEDPVQFLTGRPAVLADLLETGPPTIEITDPTPATARRAVRVAGRAGDLDATGLADFVYAVNEVVTNALCHGTQPIRLRLWSGRHRMAATVTDQGRGPADPFTGLLPPSDTSSGGTGLWLTHHLCRHVTLSWGEDRFTVHLAAAPAPTA